ncbi:helix-turn-helix transcriptional regulator [Nitrosomonas sp.]|uniref:helix-turn-helix domain-containing protein n=1 Tax=Nitrosomonas sp. TaxID=42353 RepID=UPI00284A908A|nr:helix-turn-helix transcriptional regulator [Nitrosomonas sp.]MDR4513149.1 helix-turn-helix transcriptional regulator [Nitrosomonas sp.]
MEINRFIEMGVAKTGSQKALAKALDIDVTVLSAVKAGRRGLSNVVCIKLADLIKVERIEVIAASDLVTEKDEEKRKVFESCFGKTSRAASLGALALISSILTFVPNSPTHAASSSEYVNNINYKQLIVDQSRVCGAASDI